MLQYGKTLDSDTWMRMPTANDPNKIMTVLVKTWGDLACFTRPEMKVERVSYAVVNPSAARGVGTEAKNLSEIHGVRFGRWLLFGIHHLGR